MGAFQGGGGPGYAQIFLEREDVKRVLSNVHAGVVEGRRLADAMAREPRSFPPLYRAMVAAGEGAGTLPSILERLALSGDPPPP